ncbi:citrate synthase/methylcitrate synthase [Alicyclobacillus macrosporangiidus]|uniref:Citrate synthase n=1 Tax=Alicyclobacillus macrosporangiidus TaxID=392015 RepID=A0A1I7KS37_9BACL|nr:citrate synthase/methylcitrate synthase [Alicyclobacillus macrosporangiidus]SFV00227.1 citrate synthase [Alicyclobacillus macrosporangiidus]
MANTRGLEGVVAAETELSLVDGERGHLVFRGHWARELARSRSFEDVAHLLWTGRLPAPEEAAAWQAQMAAARTLPEHVYRVMDALPAGLDMMSVVRTAVSALGAAQDWPPSLADAIRFTAAVPTIIAYRHARNEGRSPVAPRPDLPHVANYLYMLTGRHPAPDHVRALEAYLVITMEHGMNASTFTARVVTSTQSDMASALSAAIGAMKGPLHGGAPAGVMDMLEQIGTPERAESWIRSALARGERLMGFGHRVYKTTDPRALALRDVVTELAGEDPWFSLATQVEDVAIRLLEEHKPGRRLYTNVEYWAAAVLRAVGIPKPLYTATFTASRTVGWTAHILEQAAHNRLIRPQSVYVGPMPAAPTTPEEA